MSDVVFQNPYHRAGQASKLGDLDQEVGSHLQTLVIYKLVSNQSHYTSTLILLLKKVVLCSQFLGTKFIKYECLDMRSNHLFLTSWSVLDLAGIRRPAVQTRGLENDDLLPF